MRIRNYLFYVVLAIFGVSVAEAQIPAVPNGIPNVTQVPGKLLYRSPAIQDRVMNIAYHNGKFYPNTVGSGNRKVWKLTNTNNASSFTHELGLTDDDIPSFLDQGNHSHTKVDDYLGGFYGFRIKRQSLGVNSFQQNQMPEFSELDPSDGLGHTLYWPAAQIFFCKSDF